MKLIGSFFFCLLGILCNSDTISSHDKVLDSAFEEILHRDTETSLDALKKVTEKELKNTNTNNVARMFLIYSDDCKECMQMATKLISLKAHLDVDNIKTAIFKIESQGGSSKVMEHDIMKVPDILIAYNDSSCILRDNIPIDQMREWVVRVLHPSSVEIKNMNDVDSIISQKGRVIVIAYIPEASYKLEYILKQLNCYYFNLKYYILRNEEIAKSLNLKPGSSINIYREGKFLRSLYIEKGKRLNLVPLKTYLLHSHESVADYFSAYEHEYELERTIIYFYSENEDPKEVLEILANVAEEYFEKVRFFHAKVTEDNIKQLCHSFKFTKPYPLIMKTMKDYLKYVFPRNASITEDAVRTFIKNVLLGKIMIYTNSENIFSLKAERPNVLKFSSSLLNTVPRINFTVLLIHTEGCSLCDAAASHFESLAEEHKYETEYIFGTYNYYENYHESLLFDDASFPKIVAFFRSSDYILYKGDINFDDLNNWVTKGVPGEVVKVH